MDTELRMRKILGATPEQLAAVDEALLGERKNSPPPLKLYRMGEAACETGLSRTTLWRAIKDKRLKAVEIREGSFRIPETELRRFVGAE